jgi:D-alanyl-D-alanine carboxypeptidase (penicillin-binding protein 5/6)
LSTDAPIDQRGAIEVARDATASSVAFVEIGDATLEAARRSEIEAMRRRRELARRKRRAKIRRNRLLVAAALLVVAVLGWSLTGNSGSGAGTATPARAALIGAPLRQAVVVPGQLRPIPWPSEGEGALAVLGEGLMARSARSTPVPIASLTKMMTALVVLNDHPLAEGGEGPTFTMDAGDVAAWVRASQSDESNVEVQAGEHLTEHQLLEALLIPSADNIADYLAIWDAGSMPAFVAKMNATAKRLGLTETHYADASGVDPASRSDAADQAVVAAALMENPVVRGIVSHSYLAYPVEGTINNYNPGLGVDGIVGVKSGYTSEAKGCLATAAWRSVDGHAVLVVAVALGQSDGLGGAATADEHLLDAATPQLTTWRPPAPTRSIGLFDPTGAALPLALAAPMPVVVGWPGLRLAERVVGLGSPTGEGPDGVVAHLTLATKSGELAAVPLSTRRGH